MSSSKHMLETYATICLITRGLWSVGECYRIELAPFSQRTDRRFLLEIVPLLEYVPAGQQALEAGISSSPAEHLPHLVKVFRLDLPGEVQREGLAEIELLLVRYLQVLLIIF